MTDRIYPSQLPLPRASLWWDGEDFRVPKVDGDHHPQVDVLSSALPTDAATEATLATLATEAKLELVRLLLVSIAAEDFATQTTLASLLTELQAKADLTETQPISAASLPLPAGAATESKLTEVDTRLDAIKVTRGNIDYGYRDGALASSASWTTVLEVTAKGVLIGLDVATNYKLTQLLIYLDGDAVILPARDGLVRYHLIPQRLHEIGGESIFFSEGLYDDTNDHYALYLNQEIHYNASLAIYCKQESGVAKNVAVGVYYQPIT